MPRCEVNEYCPNSLNPYDAISSIRAKRQFYMANPNYFMPDGIWVWSGSQGKGKTISMVRTALQIADKFPCCRVISNLDIKGIDRCEELTDIMQVVEEDNGVEGLLFVIDEIQVLLNSLESRNIPIPLIASLCQMRKKRRVILGTSQVYSRIAKPVREQLKYLTICNNWFSLLQINTTIDPTTEQENAQGHIQGDICGREIFFHTPRLYAAYDTYKTIERV